MKNTVELMQIFCAPCGVKGKKSACVLLDNGLYQCPLCNHTFASDDDPFWDGTDGAHPAWWRGHHQTVRVFCDMVHKMLDGEDNGEGKYGEPLETLRRRILEWKKENSRLYE